MPVIIREVHIRAEATGRPQPAQAAGAATVHMADREALIEAVAEAVLARLDRRLDHPNER